MADILKEADAIWPELLRLCGGSPFGWQSRVLHARERTGDSRAVLLLSNGKVRRIAKVHGTDTPMGRAASEIAAQQRAYGALSSEPDCRVPEVLAIHPGGRACLMEHVDGPDARHAFAAAVAGIGDRERILSLCGSFVGRLHDRGFEKDGWRGPDWHRSVITGLAEEVRKGKREVIEPEPFLASADRFMQRTANAGLGKVRIALSHGDMKPGNLIIAGETVWGIDFKPVDTSPTVIDITRFIVDAAMIDGQDGLTTPLRLLDYAAFLDGCGEGLAEDPVLNWMLEFTILRRWSEIAPAQVRRLSHRQKLAGLLRLVSGVIGD